ncbi:MAG TPA: RNA polymerase sigma factor [Polyangiaceae bacterium]|nr:RNA polymerase sigma factor [Polyangiaceae bacterium]
MVIRRIAPEPPARVRERTALPEKRVDDAAMGPLEWSDPELLRALAAQDPRAGVALYDRLIRVVEWTILRVVGERGTDHDDLIQSAFEQIVISLYRQRYARECSLTSWASAISCHIALNALRARRRVRWLGSLHAQTELQPPARPDLEDQLAARQALERIRTELARMNGARAEVLVLHEINGLELAEIARVLGISVAAAQSRLVRGRRELLQRLEPSGEGEAK